jgi:hypothetical protein
MFKKKIEIKIEKVTLYDVKGKGIKTGKKKKKENCRLCKFVTDIKSMNLNNCVV